MRAKSIRKHAKVIRKRATPARSGAIVIRSSAIAARNGATPARSGAIPVRKRARTIRNSATPVRKRAIATYSSRILKKPGPAERRASVKARGQKHRSALSFASFWSSKRKNKKKLPNPSTSSG